MRKKNHDRKNWGSRLFKSLLLVMLMLALTTGSVFVAEVSAATQKKNTIIHLGGSSGRYILDTGYNCG